MDSESPVLVTGYTQEVDRERRGRVRDRIEQLRAEADEQEAILADESPWTAMHLAGPVTVGPIRWLMTQLEATLNAQLVEDGYRVTITVEPIP